ncbi:endonuclease/exonuclease/phosphatase family protein [Sphingomonas sp. 28-63-12]|uniref:endonuclease/exonuclease/phosphatase family protein n=1 Tax=Sphingomonas sp. 28-63-12 TaxID=1970434 RepID=UPI000BCB923F|nr:MAG: endonuclease [Sphingomonas sp. 28-63-12]
MITVASYNIHKAVGTDRQRRPERILDVLAEINADIVALQEADRRFGARASVLPLKLIEQAGWHPVTFGARAASMGWHGNMILIRQGMVMTSSEAIHLPTLEPRGAVCADLRSSTGGQVRIIGMHLDLSGLWRRRQAKAIIAHLHVKPHQIPTILMGDMNEWSATTGCLHEFARHYRIADTGPSFHARRPIARLDRIMMSRDLKLIECGVQASRLASVASDHLPIWARIEGVR